MDATRQPIVLGMGGDKAPIVLGPGDGDRDPISVLVEEDELAR
jgi:hypothetical protein